MSGPPAPAAVVVPVRDGGDLVPGFVRALEPELADNGTACLLVDDGSEQPLAVPSPHFDVVRLARPAGPYAARNAGWRTTRAPVVVFTDIRCRPDPGWLTATIEAFDDPSVAVVGADIRTLGGPGPAQRWAARTQHLRAARGLGERPGPPFVPTASLATRRSVLDALDGFRNVRAGADADLCYRVAASGLGRTIVAEDATMRWVPRERVVELWRQWFRYGRTDMALAEHHGRPTPPTDLRHVLVEPIRDAVGAIVGRRGRRATLEVVEAGCRIAGGLGRRAGPDW